MESSVNKWWQITAWAHKGTIIIQEWKLSFDGMLFYIVIIVKSYQFAAPEAKKYVWTGLLLCPITFDCFFCNTLGMLDNCYFLIVSLLSFSDLFSLLVKTMFFMQIFLFLFPSPFRSYSFTTCRWIQIHFFIPLGP